MRFNQGLVALVLFVANSKGTFAQLFIQARDTGDVALTAGIDGADPKRLKRRIGIRFVLRADDTPPGKRMPRLLLR